MNIQPALRLGPSAILRAYSTVAFALLLICLALGLSLKSRALNREVATATNDKQINADTSEAYFVFDCPPIPEIYVFKLTDPAKIQQAREILATGQKKMIAGTIIKQPVYYNPPWSYHLDPKEIGFVDAAVEWCDASIKGIDLDPDRALPSWCPWASRLLREIPPPDKPGSGNINPTVSMTFPYADNIYRTNAPAEVVLQANADDPDGEIVKVEFFHGVEKIGESTSYPYKVTWTNLPAANYSVFAVATDNNEATTTSKTVTFTVQAQSTSAISLNYAGTGSANSSSFLQGWLGPDLRGEPTTTVVSADGRYVVFRSEATDLLSNLTAVGQCYVRDRGDSKTMLVSGNQSGVSAGNGICINPMISADGRFVLFTSFASDLVTTDTNNRTDVFIRDLETQTTKLVSINRDGTDSGKAPSAFPILDPKFELSYGDAISADGRFILFRSYAIDLVGEETNGALNLFVRDMVAGTTVCVNVNLAGKPTGNLTRLSSSGSFLFNDVLSRDGRFVAFESSVNDLVDNDTVCSGPCDGMNGIGDVFARDVANKKTTLVSINRAGSSGGNVASSEPSISADGRMIAFRSFATDLVSNDRTPQSDIYVRDMTEGVTTLVSVNKDGTGAGSNGGGVGMNSYYPHISANGRFVAFGSNDVDLVPNKTNNLPSDVFVRDLLTNKTSFVSVNRNGNDGGRDEKNNSVPRVFSGDGRFLVFYSNAADIVPTDTDAARNIFISDLFTGTTSLVDVTLTGMSSGGDGAQSAHITRDGRFVIFQSYTPNLVENDGKDNTDVFVRTIFKENPLDDAYFFVRQQYVDFLGREPDGAGEDFWIKELAQCGSDQHCIEVKRINVSAAFFLSIEFQQTGYLVERSYKAAYGDAKGASSWNDPHQLDVPILRFKEFLSDSQRIGQNLVVLQPGWEQKLESNKQAFFQEFVQRPRFAAAFPDSITPEQFVAQLNQNVGNVLSATDRAQAVSLFGGSTYATNKVACAQALRLVAENQNLSNAEFNRAFVLMQYFGYLRRDPNSSQDTDYTGYDFWLTKLNQFNGNYIDAEMVKAFISSIEYWQRFGP